MSQELLYTSAPKGLRPGSRGFCMVLCSEGMPAPLATALEALSAYKPVYPPGDPQESKNPVNRMHVIVSAIGRRLHVISRVASSGLDYSGRPNKLAHHVVLDPKDRSAAGPAWLIGRRGVLQMEWSGEPRQVSASRSLPSGNVDGGICHEWSAATGDAGWAGVLAESLLGDANRIAYLIHDPGFDPFPLIAEAILLLPPDRRWDVTFSTYSTNLPAGVICNWRCIPSDSPLVHQSKRHVHALRINLTEPLGRATGGELVEYARTGLREESEARKVTISDRVTEVAGTYPVRAGSPVSGRPQEFRRADSGRPPRLRRSRPAVPAAIAVVLISISAAVYFYLPDGRRRALKTGDAKSVAASEGNTSKDERSPPLPSSLALTANTLSEEEVASGPSQPTAAIDPPGAKPRESDTQAALPITVPLALEPVSPNPGSSGLTEWILLPEEVGRSIEIATLPERLPKAKRLQILTPIRPLSDKNVSAAADLITKQVSETDFEFSVVNSGLDPFASTLIGTLTIRDAAGHQMLAYTLAENSQRWQGHLDGTVVCAFDGDERLIWRAAIATRGTRVMLNSDSKPVLSPLDVAPPQFAASRGSEDAAIAFHIPIAGLNRHKDRFPSILVPSVTLLLDDPAIYLTFDAEVPLEGTRRGVLAWNDRVILRAHEFGTVLSAYGTTLESLHTQPRIPDESKFPLLVVAWDKNSGSDSLTLKLQLHGFFSEFRTIVQNDLGRARRNCTEEGKKLALAGYKGDLTEFEKSPPDKLFEDSGRTRLNEFVGAATLLKDQVAQFPTAKVDVSRLDEAINQFKSICEDSVRIEKLQTALQALRLTPSGYHTTWLKLAA